jgi:hypothetical protein
MKFFKSNQPMSEEDEAAAVRLIAVANRTKAATMPKSPYAAAPDASDPLELRDILQ